MAKNDTILVGDNSEEALLERYLRELAAYPPLSDEQERTLSAKSLAGDEQARQALVNANLKFVVSIARQYASPSVSILDLINEGNIALMRAAEKYDAAQGKRFATYAVWALRQTMRAFCADRGVTVKNTDMDNHPLNKSYAEEESALFDDRDSLLAAISSLSPRDQLVLKSVYGLEQEQMTMREIGERYNMTRARVRQIRKRALHRLSKIRADLA